MKKKKDLEKVICILKEALDEDESSNYIEAIDLYTNAIELFLELVPIIKYYLDKWIQLINFRKRYKSLQK